MSGNRSPQREAEVLEFIRDCGRVSLSQVMSRFEIKGGTAQSYLQGLKEDGKAANTGKGHTSKWYAIESKPQSEVTAAIKGAASVWNYAQRFRG